MKTNSAAGSSTKKPSKGSGKPLARPVGSARELSGRLTEAKARAAAAKKTALAARARAKAAKKVFKKSKRAFKDAADAVKALKRKLKAAMQTVTIAVAASGRAARVARREKALPQKGAGFLPAKAAATRTARTPRKARVARSKRPTARKAIENKETSVQSQKPSSPTDD